MIKPIEIEKTKIDQQPYLIWNTFIELISNDSCELDDIQAVAHFAFRYDSEVQNGGHLQYFENTFNIYRGKEDIAISTTLEALRIIGADKQFKILSRASKQYLSHKRKHPDRVDEFIDVELENEFGNFDNRYFECDPDMNVFLHRYLEDHIGSFVKIISHNDHTQ